MSKYIPVEAEKWAEMVQAMALAADLMVENKRLAAENEQLRGKIEAMRIAGDIVEARRYIVDRCKHSTESEGWERAKKGLPSRAQQWDREKANRFAAENERLRKAGEWQPMETAPTDKSVIIAFIYRNPEVAENVYLKFCYWSDAEKGWDGIAHSIRKGEIIPVGWVSRPDLPTLSDAKKMMLRNAAKEGGAK